MNLDLNRNEIEELKEMVDARLGDMMSEIRHSMVTDYRHELKARKVVLEQLSEKLTRAAEPSATLPADPGTTLP